MKKHLCGLWGTFGFRACTSPEYFTLLKFTGKKNPKAFIYYYLCKIFTHQNVGPCSLFMFPYRCQGGYRTETCNGEGFPYRFSLKVLLPNPIRAPCSAPFGTRQIKLGRFILLLTGKSSVLVAALETNTTGTEAPTSGTKRNVLGTKPHILGQVWISHMGLAQAGEGGSWLQLGINSNFFIFF